MLSNSFNFFNDRNVKFNHVKEKIKNVHPAVVGKMILPLHLLNLIAELYAAVFTHDRVEGPILANAANSSIVLSNFKKNRFCYFTGWTFIMQMTFLGLAVSHEVSEVLNLSLSVRKKLGRARAVIFDTFTLPCTMLTVSVFWVIWHIDKELIFPSELSRVFPDWLNHMLHTFIVVPVVVEILAPKKYSFVDYKVAARTLFLFAVVYQIL
ncbi:unnamed protein product [Acanthoscelides obtectus]|nr:unnamed protein product [Acanthoscelides obtectus]CAH2001166.1 unnamed protein product [Acanthoscelides obtectus]CAK1665578.1 Androgen-dependent TFPI-regulating protein [Acanthoscelides obtectus]CAK1665639.1 Androgen-dependent TFPI-regulating protein [Acanthoscelides obtectus]